MEINYPQDYHDWLPAVFGCEDGGPGLQFVGSVDTRSWRSSPHLPQHPPASSTTFFARWSIETKSSQDPSPVLGRSAFKGFEYGKCTLSAEGLVARTYWGAWYRFGSTSTRVAGWSVRWSQKRFPISPEEPKDLRLKLMDEREAFVIVRQDEAFKKDRNSHSANIDLYQFIWITCRCMAHDGRMTSEWQWQWQWQWQERVRYIEKLLSIVNRAKIHLLFVCVSQPAKFYYGSTEEF